VITREEVLHVALLSRLEVTEPEVDRFTTELQAILGHVEQLQGLDLAGVEPMSHPLALENVMRADERRPSLAHEAVLSNAPKRDHQGFVVPPVIGQGG
jgi:aspartyl-tRNA(Asn)/glutamyl-tRNA(Gln) amidotransferase subunit C